MFWFNESSVFFVISTWLLGAEATLSIVGGVCYGRARQQMEDEVDEQKTLLKAGALVEIQSFLSSY